MSSWMSGITADRIIVIFEDAWALYLQPQDSSDRYTVTSRASID